MPRSCIVPFCNEGYGSKPSRYSFFCVPKDPVKRKKWQAAIPRKLELKPGQAVCEKHFAPEDIVRKKVFKDCNGAVLAEAVLKIPRCAENAVPTLFPGCPKYLSRKTPKRRRDIIRKVIPKVKKVKLAHLSNSDVQENPVTSSHNSDFITPSQTFELSIFEQLYYDEDCFEVPESWTRIIPACGSKLIFYAQIVSRKVNEHIFPVYVKQVCVDENACVTCSILGKTLSHESLRTLKEPLKSCQELKDILICFNELKICSGTKLDKKLSDLECQSLCRDSSGCLRHTNCSLVVSEDDVCEKCKRLKKILCQKLLQLERIL
ncbi:uncharacterized protein LOC134542569 isoform X2 [Bacillus rossius redtenbacheri]|uniref:uncharacterized protein LOC134542569 isoform X2 n=1 Tax=Bacillus rossius redtenbacheri TaxID=93214 RepID=UPI002FDD8C8A